MSNLNIKIREKSAKVMNRYPELFDELSIRFNPKNILCYGCGFGEECISIYEHFPESMIYGVDISTKTTTSARKKCKEIKNINILDINEFLEKKITFDLIFALNVFKKLNSFYEFTLFDIQLKELTDFLNYNGFLVLDGIQYNFITTETYKNNFNIYQLSSDSFIKKDKFSFNNYCFQKIKKEKLI